MEKTEKSAPETEDFRARVRAAAGRLNGAHLEIARHVLEHPTQAAFLSAEELAREVGVSSASIVRFAQNLGYDGYYAMKRALQREFQGMVGPGPAEKVQESLSRIDQVSETFRAVAELEISYLQRAIHTISPTQFERAALVLASAKRIGVLGPASSEALVDLVHFRLRRFRADILPMVHVGGKDLFEELHWLEHGDALLVFAFLQPREEIETALRYACEKGITSVAITDLESSPVNALADVTLVGLRGPVGAFHSLVVPTAIVNALILAYAKLTMPASLEALKNFQSVRKKFGVD